MPSQARTKVSPPSRLRHSPSPIVPTYSRWVVAFIFSPIDTPHQPRRTSLVTESRQGWSGFLHECRKHLRRHLVAITSDDATPYESLLAWPEFIVPPHLQLFRASLAERRLGRDVFQVG